MKNIPRIRIDEWDGDRSSAPGGFALQIVVGGEVFEKDFLSYENGGKQKLLTLFRKKARKLSAELGFPIEENLF